MWDPCLHMSASAIPLQNPSLNKSISLPHKNQITPRLPKTNPFSLPRRRNMSRESKQCVLCYPRLSNPPLWHVLVAGYVVARFGGYSSGPSRWCSCSACRSNAFRLGSSGRSGSPINADAAACVRRVFAPHPLIVTTQQLGTWNNNYSHMRRMRHVMSVL